MAARPRLAALVAAAALAGGACQTARQAWIMTGVGAGVAAGDGLLILDVHGDEEASAPLTIGAALVLAGTVTALLSLWDALDGH